MTNEAHEKIEQLRGSEMSDDTELEVQRDNLLSHARDRAEESFLKNLRLQIEAGNLIPTDQRILACLLGYGFTRINYNCKSLQDFL